ncbi:hypothetical protein [uncultured Gammaproteobacteria bacterium]|nr:hypothetical protein [uncultured Gammaproteobacteria bacterium]
MSDITASLFSQVVIAYAVSYAVTYIATGSGKAAQGAGLPAGLFMGIGGLRGGKVGADGKMHYNPGWEPGSMKTLVAHGLAGGIVQDRMGGSFGAGFLTGSVGSYFGSSGKSGNTNEMIGNTAIEAVIGGAISVVGGGKFANGAQTGAFRYLFNDSAEHFFAQGNHDYKMMSEAVCSTSSPGCSIASVALQIQTVGAFPGQDSRVLNNGTAQKFSASAFSFTSDPIISISTSTGVINITLPGHRLDPGWIARDAVVMYGSIYIRTLGYGQGSYGFFNNLLKHSVWDSVDQKVIDKY